MQPLSLSLQSFKNPGLTKLDSPTYLLAMIPKQTAAALTRMAGETCRCSSAQVTTYKIHSSGDHRDSDYRNHVAMAWPVPCLCLNLLGLTYVLKFAWLSHWQWLRSCGQKKKKKKRKKKKKKGGKKTELVCVHMTIDVLAVLTVCCELSSTQVKCPPYRSN
jgi:hypothetical protein